MTAWSTFAVFIATAALWIFTALLWWAARNEFIATHRPRLRIRNFTADNFGQVVVRVLQFNIFNIGDSVAKDIRISYAYLWTEDISDVISLFENSPRNLSVGTPIEPGDISTQSVADLEWEKQNISDKEIFYRCGRRFFIIGRAIYKDRLGVDRNTGFLREAEISKIQEQGVTIERISGFKKVNDSDYEYED
ncbi:MAG: hypothetical protein ABR924_21085 [Terracidiphilus sp.]